MGSFKIEERCTTKRPAKRQGKTTNASTNQIDHWKRLNLFTDKLVSITVKKFSASNCSVSDRALNLFWELASAGTDIWGLFVALYLQNVDFLLRI